MASLHFVQAAKLVTDSNMMFYNVADELYRVVLSRRAAESVSHDSSTIS